MDIVQRGGWIGSSHRLVATRRPATQTS